jgi:hypothetical protein
MTCKKTKKGPPLEIYKIRSDILFIGELFTIYSRPKTPLHTPITLEIAPHPPGLLCELG